MNKIIKQILKEILEEEGNITSPGEVTTTPKLFKEAIPLKKSRRFVPNEFDFPESLLKPIGFGFAQEPKIYFKIATNSKGESILMIDPLVKTALDNIERGRSSFTKEQNLGKLTLYLKERVPQQIRGLIKKYANNTKILNNGFLSLPLIMSKSDKGWVIQNPNKSDVNKDMNVPLYESEIDVPENVEKAAERLATLLNKHGEFGTINNTSDSILNTILHKRPDYFDKWFEVSNASGLPEDKNIKDLLLSWRSQAYSSFKQNSVNELEINKPKEKINQPDYAYYIYSENQHAIIAGFEYVEDANDFKNDMDSLGPLKIYTKRKLMMVGLNPDSNKAWGTDYINESKLNKIIHNMLIKEASYGQFKKEVKFRSKNEMLHKGIKTVKSKLQEVDRIVEYMSRMKQELSENDEGVQYWDKTKQSINKIQELVEMLNNKIKTL